MGDYKVLYCATYDADRSLTVMQVILDSNVSLRCEEKMEHVDIGRIARNSHRFFTGDELYIIL